MEPEKANHPGIAAVLSFIFNGLGQLYNGQIFKGLVIIFLSSLGMLVLIIGSILVGLCLLGKIISSRVLIVGSILFFIGLIFICILGIYSIIDAHRTATRK